MPVLNKLNFTFFMSVTKFIKYPCLNIDSKEEIEDILALVR